MRNVLVQICITLGLMVNTGATRGFSKTLFNQQARVAAKLANDSARVQQLQLYWNQLQARREAVAEILRTKTREATESSAAYNAARNAVANAEAALFNAKATANTLYEKYIAHMRDADQAKSELEKVEREIGSIGNQLSKGMNSVATLQGKAESLVNQLSRDLADDDQPSSASIVQPVQIGNQLSSMSPQPIQMNPNLSSSPYAGIPAVGTQITR